MKTLTLLGASGSIGKQTLEVLKNNKDYKLIGVTVWDNIDFLKQILNEFEDILYVGTHKKVPFSNEFPHIKFYSEEEGILKLIEESNSDVYVNSILGFAGVNPSFKVFELDKILLLANKETLVVAGEFLKNYPNRKLIPIDSEHVAISKCLYTENIDDVNNIYITASGGKFLNKNHDELQFIDDKEALSHPNWNMGQKITVDSNTMVNKTFELIEAYYLFNLPIEKIHATIQKDSLIHGYVEFKDKILYQKAYPDMKEPIKYALNLGKCEFNRFNDVYSESLNNMLFKDIDIKRFPVLKYFKIVLSIKGDAGCTFNAVDEVAVLNFIKGRIKFYQIEEIIDEVMTNHKFRPNIKFADLKLIDKEVREETLKIIERMNK